jgi:uncharacterized protein (TIGR02117 family)
MNGLRVFFFCFLCGCSSLPEAIQPRNLIENTCQDTAEVFILNHGWHTGTVVSADDLNRLMPALSKRFKNNTYYEIGWGDAGFYQAQQITLGLTLRAMFWSSGSVLHVVGFNGAPAHYFKKSAIKILKVNQDNYQNLLSYIKSSFMLDEKGELISQQVGIYGDSQFYAAVGGYHLFNTCNKWTAKALLSAGLPINPPFKLTAQSVMDALGEQCLTQ